MILHIEDVKVSFCSYNSLKEAIIPRTVLTEDQRIRQVLQETELWNKMLSEMLREMRRITAAPFGENPMSGELWFQRLSPQLPASLSIACKLSLAETAKIADDLASRYSPGVSALNAFSFHIAASSSSKDELNIYVYRRGSMHLYSG